MTAMSKWLRVLLLMPLMAGGLSACGFHLQGERPLPEPLQQLYIEHHSPYSAQRAPLLDYLRTEVVGRGGEIAGNKRDANSVLRILDIRTQREILTISPVDGEILEIMLIMTVEYELLDSNGDRLLRNTATANRELRFDNKQLLAKETEEEDAGREMQHELSRLLLIRLELALKA